MAEPIEHWVLTRHAEEEIAGRGLDLAMIAAVLADPEQRLSVRPGREVLQRRVAQDGKTYLVRVFVDVDRKPPAVVTAYRTSKVAKYWSALL
jgi:Domain of unknown function (DUF4258)